MSNWTWHALWVTNAFALGYLGPWSLGIAT